MNTSPVNPVTRRAVEILSLNIEALDVEMLERRLEMNLMVSADGGGTCSSYDCCPALIYCQAYSCCPQLAR